MFQSIPYLNFKDGKAAIDYYKEYFDAHVDALTTAGDPMFEGVPDLPENPDDFVMNAQLNIFGARLFISSTWGGQEVDNSSVQIALVFDENDEETAQRAKELFDKASATGEVKNPLEEVPWTKYYGAFNDRYGIHWMISGE